MSVKLVKPTSAYHDRLKEYVGEIAEIKDAEGTNGLYTAILSGGFSRWLQKQNVPNAETYLILNNDSRVVGIINIRYVLNEELKKCGGNIGYNIRPSERRKGYATEALKKCLEIAASHDLAEVYIDCYKDNVASSKTIEAAGGVLINDSYNEIRRQSVLRYRVVLKELEKQSSEKEVEIENPENSINVSSSVTEELEETILDSESIEEEKVEQTIRRDYSIKEMFALEYLRELLSVNPNVTEDMIEPDIAQYLELAKQEYKEEKQKNQGR